MIARRFAFVLAALAWLTPASGSASTILLLTNGDAANNAMIASTLQAQGDSVTIGPTFSNFTGSGLSGYNEVMLMPGYTNEAYRAPDMPVSGQQALLDFVKAGGGLVTGEGLVDMASYFKRFQTLEPALPVAYSGFGTSNKGISFSSLTTDPTLNAGLPSSVSFMAAPPGPFSSTESHFLPKAGATPFFTTNQWTVDFGGYGPAYGVIGWVYGKGGVLSLSTESNNYELADANYAQLLRNASNWATESASIPPIIPPPLPVPEPTTLAILALGGAGFLARRRANG